MMREVVVLNEAQTAKLVTMKGDVLDKDLAKRAQIILELSKGRSVREIAAERWCLTP